MDFKSAFTLSLCLWSSLSLSGCWSTDAERRGVEVEDGVLGYLMQSRQGLNTYQLCISVSVCEGESGIQVISAVAVHILHRPFY